jgi:hypothetical protein
MADLSWVTDRRIPLTRRLIGLAVFVLIMFAAWWLVTKLTYEWLPPWSIGYVALGMLGLIIGVLIGERSTLKAFAKRGMYLPGHDPESQAVHRELQRELNRRLWRGWGIAALVGVPIIIAVIALIPSR